MQIGDEQCACGRTYKLFKGGVIGRADDITKVKGVLLAPSAIEDVVRSMQGLGNEYEVIVDKKGDTDTITLKVELAEELTNSAAEQLKRRTCDPASFEDEPWLQSGDFYTWQLARYEMKARDSGT